jgi:hypothetical protein
MPTRGTDEHARHRFSSSTDELVFPSSLLTLRCTPDSRIAHGLPVVDPLASPPARSRGSRAPDAKQGRQPQPPLRGRFLCLIDIFGLSVVAHSPFGVVADDLVSCPMVFVLPGRWAGSSALLPSSSTKTLTFCVLSSVFSGPSCPSCGPLKGRWLSPACGF